MKHAKRICKSAAARGRRGGNIELAGLFHVNTHTEYLVYFVKNLVTQIVTLNVKIE